MPAKQRRPKRRTDVDVLTESQRLHLVAGHDFFDDVPFATEAARFECWRRHRAQVMASWTQPGKRPAAFWDYDATWPDTAVSEAAAVYQLADTLLAERRAIEADWHTRVGIVLLHARDMEAAALLAADEGIPPEFFRQHAAEIWAGLAAERDAAIQTEDAS